MNIVNCLIRGRHATDLKVTPDFPGTVCWVSVAVGAISVRVAGGSKTAPAPGCPAAINAQSTRVVASQERARQRNMLRVMQPERAPLPSLCPIEHKTPPASDNYPDRRQTAQGDIKSVTTHTIKRYYNPEHYASRHHGGPRGCRYILPCTCDRAALIFANGG